MFRIPSSKSPKIELAEGIMFFLNILNKMNSLLMKTAIGEEFFP
ncbi:hypothetical protein LEP1GSC047_1145 [Leptospira inadai serovar Lyme str. 10]|uniref:Uncharacterized protein n=1 Tax=Leptospira inadai serovar Lyme str. 10 TaxID=1049790 RepID=V6HQM6_9LEPT|nr:hypothetical protein LEP1GSC047_1145 [Leptospira inadai serovar Lyme str. 10]